MYFPDRGCVHTLLPLYVYAIGVAKNLSLESAIVLAERGLLAT